MRNGNFYERRKFSKKNKNTKSKEGYNPSSKQDYSLGNLLSDIGNQQVQRFFEGGFIQAKLNVNQPGDIYEQEADRIAGSIINNNTENVANTAKVSHLQARSNTGNLSVNGNTESSIKNLKGKGSPLSKSVKDYFEPRFGVDLDHIKIHKNSQSNQLAKSINAKAFTYGNDIVFGENQFQPDTTAGKELIAHELTHTLQQGEGVNQVIQRDLHEDANIDNSETERRKEIIRRAENLWEEPYRTDYSYDEDNKDDIADKADLDVLYKWIKTVEGDTIKEIFNCHSYTIYCITKEKTKDATGGMIGDMVKNMNEITKLDEIQEGDVVVFYNQFNKVYPIFENDKIEHSGIVYKILSAAENDQITITILNKNLHGDIDEATYTIKDKSHGLQFPDYEEEESNKYFYFDVNLLHADVNGIAIQSEDDYSGYIKIYAPK